MDKLIRKIIREAAQENNNYMLFSNLQQIKRQCEMLLELNQDTIDSIIDNGHDWADDHITVAKENMDQVFDFIMNETKKNANLSEENKKGDKKLCSRGKSAAKSKFDVYPSQYANAYAVKVCQGKIKGLDGQKKCSSPYC